MSEHELKLGESKIKTHLCVRDQVEGSMPVKAISEEVIDEGSVMDIGGWNSIALYHTPSHLELFLQFKNHSDDFSIDEVVTCLDFVKFNRHLVDKCDLNDMTAVFVKFVTDIYDCSEDLDEYMKMIGDDCFDEKLVQKFLYDKGYRTLQEKSADGRLQVFNLYSAEGRSVTPVKVFEE